MAGKFKLEIDVQGFNEARLAPEIQADLHRRGEQIASAAGGAPDFEVIDAPSKTRARVVVVTATGRAKALEAVHRALTTALDAGRG